MLAESVASTIMQYHLAQVSMFLFGSSTISSNRQHQPYQAQPVYSLGDMSGVVFFRTRLKLFGQIAAMQKPAILAKTEADFLTATLMFLPSVGTISAEVASEVMAMLDAPEAARMTEQTLTTVQESIANITDQNMPGTSNKITMLSLGTDGPSRGDARDRKKAQPSPSTAEVQPDTVGKSQPIAEARPGTGDKTLPTAEAKPSTEDISLPTAEAQPGIEVTIQQPSFISGVSRQSFQHFINYFTEHEWIFLKIPTDPTRPKPKSWRNYFSV